MTRAAPTADGRTASASAADGRTAYGAAPTGGSAALGPAEFRTNFPMLASTVHLAGCSLGARSAAVDAALLRMLDELSRPAGAWHTFEAEVDSARRRFAALIGAEPQQVAIVPNASIGAYQAVSTIDLSRRNRLVTTTREFPSVAHVWLAQRRRGAEVGYVEDGPAGNPLTLTVEHYADLVDDRTALVSVPLVTYEHGSLLPVPGIVELARDRGARTFVDAYQALGVVPVDVRRLGCDYLVSGVQKHLLGIPGLAFLYARDPDPGDLEPTLTGWFGRSEPFAFDPRLLDFAAGARRFETGTAPVPAAFAANAGLGLLAGLAPEQVRGYITDLLGTAASRLTAQGEELWLPDGPTGQGAHVALRDPDPAALTARLAERGVAVSPRGGAVRLSFHYYNDDTDIDRLCAAFRDIRAGYPRAGQP